MLAFLSLTALSACSTWPPFESLVSRQFQENRNAYDALQLKLDKSEFWRVTQTGIVNVPRVREGHEVYADPKDGGSSGKVVVEDDPEWEALFQATGMWGVARVESGVAFFPAGRISERKRTLEISIIHRVSPDLVAKPCKPVHSKLPCGWCAVELDDDWHIEYWWQPSRRDDSHYEAFMNGEMTIEESVDERAAAIAACYRDGLAEMGYDLSDFE
ncbi:MAG: hypothetical protein AAF662_01545 [Pseudomonadota bacterium]